MRVVIAGDYPEDPPNVLGGIQAVIYNTLCHLGDYDDLDLHIVTCEKWRSRPLARPQTVQAGRWTVHYLPSSPRVPHTISMLTLDRWAVRRQIESLSPDLIHAHGQAAAYPFAAFDTGRPTVVTVHGFNRLEAQADPRGGPLKSRLRTALWGYTEQCCLRRASDIVVISPFVYQVIAPWTQARLHLVENPVQDEFFDLEPAPEPGKILMVGSVRRVKGILEAVQALALIHRQIPGAELYVAGSLLPPHWEYAEVVRRRIAELGVGNHVHLLGHLDHEALLAAFCSSQVFLLPSYLESSPVALLEAMAAGLPSVVSDIGGTAHLVEDGVTGYRVPVGDVVALAESLVRLVRDGTTCQRMGRRAREFARSHASAEVAASKTHELYLKLAGARR